MTRTRKQLETLGHKGQTRRGETQTGDATMTLEALARQMMLTAAQAVALPATLDCAAEKVGMDRDQMVAQCAAKPALREYLAGICRKVV